MTPAETRHRRSPPTAAAWDGRPHPAPPGPAVPGEARGRRSGPVAPAPPAAAGPADAAGRQPPPRRGMLSPLLPGDRARRAGAAAGGAEPSSGAGVRPLFPAGSRLPRGRARGGEGGGRDAALPLRRDKPCSSRRCGKPRSRALRGDPRLPVPLAAGPRSGGCRTPRPLPAAPPRLCGGSAGARLRLRRPVPPHTCARAPPALCLGPAPTPPGSAGPCTPLPAARPARLCQRRGEG